MEDETRKGSNSGELPTECAYCGSAVDPEVWHPSTSVMDEAGVHRIRLFCDEQCQEEWASR